MIETWFKEDIQKAFDRSGDRFVVCDPYKLGDYLLKSLPSNWKVYEASSEIEELKAKYEIEKSNKDTKVVIYATIPAEELTFLMEYAQINGFLDLEQFHHYIKKKVHQKIGLNLELDKDELETAAKVSVGNKKDYWLNLSRGGSGEIFDLSTMLVPFLDDSKAYVRGMDKEVQEAFLEKVQKQIGQQPMSKPAQTVAEETVLFMLNGLANNGIDDLMLDVYRQWIDSTTYRKSFNKYLDNFSQKEIEDIWSVHPDHPFEEVDREQLRQIVSNLGDEKFTKEKTPYIKRRAKNQYARLCGIDWWNSVLGVIQFDYSGIKTINSFEEAKAYYTQTFYKLDRSVRNLYAEFLHDEALMQPLQERYNSMVNELLDKWFSHFGDYKEGQTGLFKRLIEKHSESLAIIVGDGITYEIAEEFVSSVDHKLKVEKNTMLADLPSVTDNNMSRMYMSDGSWTKDKSKREKFLKEQFSDKRITFVDLEHINPSISDFDVAVCSYKDIDDIGEKMQQKALKFINTIKETLADKIVELEKLGFQNIYLVSDHGFVLTGILKESDKIEYNPNDDFSKGERYLALKEKPQLPNNLFAVEKSYLEYNHLVVSKNLRSFKTTGAYGFAHGGASPQELIVPCFMFSSGNTVDKLKIKIGNKVDLQEVEGENFEIRLQTPKGGQDLFSVERKCRILVYAGEEEIASSDVINLEAGDTAKREFSFDGNMEVQVHIIDSDTKEHLDKVTVKKSSGRDLGGLL